MVEAGAETVTEVWRRKRTTAANIRHARRGAKESAAGTTAEEAKEKKETTALTAIDQAAEEMVANNWCTMFGVVGRLNLCC